MLSLYSRIRFLASILTLGLCFSSNLLPVALGETRAAIATTEAMGPVSGPYRLTGAVVNETNGEPVPKAAVQLNYNGRNRSTFTDPEGHFEFTDLPAERALLMFDKPGYFPFTSTDVQIGAQTDATVVKLSPQARISGTIEDAGEPLEHLPVALYGSGIVNGIRQLSLMTSASTDDEGAFRLPGLRPGRYVLHVGPSAMVQQTPAGTQIYSEVYYPGVSETSGATFIDVAAGQQVSVSLDLKGTMPVEISGTVLGSAGTVQFQLIGWASSMPLPWQMDYDNKTGQFHGRVIPGHYVLKAFSAVEGKAILGEKELDVTSNLSGITISLNPLPSIPVIFRMESGNQPTKPMFPAVNLTTTNHPLAQTTAYMNRKETSSGPTFSLDGVTPGEYRLDIQYPNGWFRSQNWYVQSASSGGTDLLQENLVVTVGVTPSPIEIVQRNDGGAVSGKILSDGAPAAGSIILIPQHAHRNISLANAGADGKFSITALAPGEYSLLAVDQLYEIEYANPEALSNYASKITHITVQANEKLDINPSLIRVEH